MTDRMVWENLYWKTWAGILPDAAYAHPAKFAPGLIEQIYRYMRKDLAIPAGSVVFDPFAGVATGALFAMLYQFDWIGHEIELAYHTLASQTIQHWESQFSAFGPLGKAFVFLKDSSDGPYDYRDLDINVIVSSPPFGKGETRNRTSYQDGEIASNMKRAYTVDNQGSNTRNLANLDEDGAIFDAIVSSPPYENVIKGGEGPGARHDSIYHSEDNSQKISSDNSYGNDPGQLGISSGADFWSASANILLYSFNALQPGGYAIWVCKDYVRKGIRIPFSDRWQALSEKVGFTLHQRIEASLVTDYGTQLSMFANENMEDLPKDQRHFKERKTFWRRNSESKGSPRIDHEDVIIMRKPNE